MDIQIKTDKNDPSKVIIDVPLKLQNSIDLMKVSLEKFVGLPNNRQTQVEIKGAITKELMDDAFSHAQNRFGAPAANQAFVNPKVWETLTDELQEKTQAGKRIKKLESKVEDLKEQLRILKEENDYLKMLTMEN